MRTRFFKMICLALANLALFCPGLAQSAAPQTEPFRFIGRYAFDWSDIPLAGAELAIQEDKTSYSIHLTLISGGIVNLFTRHRSDTLTTGRRESGHFHSQSYESHYWTKNKPRHIKLAWDRAGILREELVEPPEDRSDRPEVPHALKDGSIDPLTVLLAFAAGEPTPKVFDAKHLWNVNAARGDETTLRGFNDGKPVTALTLSRKPMSGMTQKEIVQYNKGEPLLTLYYPADGRPIPLYMSVPLYLGRLQGSLVQTCKTWDECKVN